MLSGIGHLGKLFGKHPEEDDVAKVAFVEVGTFDKDGLGDGGGNDTDGGPGFLFEFLVGLPAFLLLTVILFKASLLLVLSLEGVVHNEFLDVGGKLLSARLRGLDDDLQQKGTRACAVVIVLQSYPRSQRT